MAAQERIAALASDRRQVLEFLLDLQHERGVPLALPIGMDRPEPWLLDALDAPLLLRALRAPPPGNAPIELALYCASGGTGTTPIPGTSPRRRASGADSDDLGSDDDEDGDGRGAGGRAAAAAAAAAAALRARGRSITGVSSISAASGAGQAPDADNEPELPMARLLGAGLDEPQLKDLAYLVLAATAATADNAAAPPPPPSSSARRGPSGTGGGGSGGGGDGGGSGGGGGDDGNASASTTSTAADVLAAVRGALDVGADRAAEVARVVALVRGTVQRTADQLGEAPVSDGWTASLEMVLVMLETLLPRDFRRFRDFAVWRSTLGSVLLQSLTQGVRDSWAPPPPSADGEEEGEGGGEDGAPPPPPPSAHQMIARLKGALRRCDVRSADDFDEAEYRDAVAALGAAAMDIVRCLSTGWQFPWGLRVRLVEVLLRGVFDPLEGGAYVAEADDYLALLQTRVWPLLGVGPAVHNSCFAWAHFRQFVVTKAPVLVGAAKSLLRRLWQLSRAARAGGASGDGGGRSGGNSFSAAEAGNPEDVALVSEIGTVVIDWIAERVSDYHRRARTLGGPRVLGGLVDVLAFAAQSRGDTLESVAGMLVEFVEASVDRELSRRIDAAGPHADEASALAAAIRAAAAIAEEEVDVWAPAFAAHLPEASGVASARLHSQVGARLLPFIGSMAMEPAAVEVVRLAIETEPALLVPAQGAQAAVSARSPAARALATAKPWGVLAQLQPVVARWAAAQAAGFDVWVRRQLEKEDWRPLGAGQPFSHSARELRRLALESLDALFGFGVPLPAEAVALHLEALEGAFRGYADLVLARLGPWRRMVPPPPPLVRYKREVSVAAEADERGLPGPPTRLPPPGAKKWIESVPRIEAEPCYAEITAIAPQAVAVMLASLGYLEAGLAPMAESAARRWQDAARVDIGAGAGTAGALDHDGSEPGGGDPSNPFLRPPAGRGNGTAGGSSGGGGDDNPFRSGGGGSRGGDAANPFLTPTHAASSSPYAAAAQSPVNGDVGSFTRSVLHARGRSGGNGSGGGAELLTSLLEGAAQSLRRGMDAVAKWLAVRVVWWDLRGEWCELLYRHRVTAARLDFVEERLAHALGALAALLPERERLLVAEALLREVAAALERALLDGGPTRLYVPADVDAIATDVAALKQLFHADGDGLGWQAVDDALAGLNVLLEVMEAPTATLVARHSGLRRAALLAAGGGSGSPRAGGPGASPSPRGGGGGSRFGVAGALSFNQTLASDPAAAGARTPPGSAGGGHRGASFGLSPTAAAAAATSPLPAATYAPLPLPPGLAPRDLADNDQVLLRVLCHRADHAASKYLKESVRLPKLRDESLKETMGRLAGFRP